MGTPWVFEAIDHVQLAMPAGGEKDAEDFYGGVLGFSLIPKPENLAVRGGRWFEAGHIRIHLGVEPDFRPARKAHPALVVSCFDAFVDHLRSSGVPFVGDEEIPGLKRGYIDDCFGNRLELIEAPS
jgi:catechol 2,3-dioxygenase-like lactoylglutathione lyase family enzyme